MSGTYSSASDYTWVSQASQVLFEDSNIIVVESIIHWGC